MNIDEIIRKEREESQAVLDEYLHHLWGNEGDDKLTDERLLALATTIQQVLTPVEERSLLGSPTVDADSIMCYQLPGSITKSGRLRRIEYWQKKMRAVTRLITKSADVWIGTKAGAGGRCISAKGRVRTNRVVRSPGTIA